MDIHKNESRKIIIVGAFLLVLLGAAVILRSQRNVALQQTFRKIEAVIPTPTPDIYVGSYLLEPDKKEFKTGDNFSLTVSFDRKAKKLYGADAILKFDPAYLSADTNLTLGTYFDNYPRREVDNNKGYIKVTGFRLQKSQEDNIENGMLFVANFKAKKSGFTTISLEYQKGKTNQSTLVEAGTSQNILGNANTVKLNIE
jgi:hypothetical protein